MGVCSTIETIFLGWVEEVRTVKALVCGAQEGICRVNTFFSPIKQKQTLFLLVHKGTIPTD
jgi:hypothetical protein